eukprot:gene19667-21614_t
MRLADHCIPHDEEVASSLVLWQTTEGTVNRGRRRTTYVDNLMKDATCESAAEMRDLMVDRTCWRERVASVGRQTWPT